MRPSLILLLYIILPILINGFAGFDFTLSATATIDKYVGRSSYAKIKEIWNCVMKNGTIPNDLPKVTFLQAYEKSLLHLPIDSEVCVHPIQYSLQNEDALAELKCKADSLRD